eukprot:TRINITY_DN20797_c0_g1_i1.p1 TRINITY_DN20797_c0_g1~~TRINITY_DN20797_c0_g1_i1.p1  ORF type:complete len:392 (+),score=70.26 TRINITY_DN20797_c0_g1_i1:57-1178(+)
MAAPPPKNVFTEDPNGNVMVGVPIQPKQAYPSQTMPSQQYFQPPTAFYQPPPPPVAGGSPSYPVVEAVQATAPPPPFYYGPTEACQAMVTDVRPVGLENPYVADTSYSPSAEVTADFCGGNRSVTNGEYQGDPSLVTHVNYHDNRLKSITNLNSYRNLLRLTVSWNDLKTLRGVQNAPYLRWIDASGNHLSNFEGLGSMPALEWLNVTQSDIESFNGLEFAPNLSWLCLHHNRFHDFKKANALPGLQFIDVSDNEVQHVEGLEKAINLREINLCNNPMCEGNVRRNVESVKSLASLRFLTKLNINDTFYDPEEAEIVKHFSIHAPQCEVITTPERTAQVGHNYKFNMQDVPLKGRENFKRKSKSSSGCKCIIC